MLNISEAFGAQQLIGDIGRRVANKTAGRDANGGDFRRPLLGKRIAAVEQACHTRQG
jgi:hypothetical protein